MCNVIRKLIHKIPSGTGTALVLYWTLPCLHRILTIYWAAIQKRYCSVLCFYSRYQAVPFWYWFYWIPTNCTYMILFNTVCLRLVMDCAMFVSDLICTLYDDTKTVLLSAVFLKLISNNTVFVSAFYWIQKMYQCRTVQHRVYIGYMISCIGIQ